MQALFIVIQLALLAGSCQASSQASEQVSAQEPTPPPKAAETAPLPVVELTSRVNEVMVDASGAALTRLVDVTLDEGLTRLQVILSDSTLNADTHFLKRFTIVASGAEILHHTIHETTSPPNDSRLEALRDELSFVSQKAGTAEERMLGATADIDLLESVARTIAETRVELDSDSLLELIESINTRRRVIIEDLARQKRVFEETRSRQEQLTEELKVLERGVPRVVCEIVARSSGGNARFALTRKDAESEWSSEIEIDWNSRDSSARARVLGRIINRSGVDWRDVRLTLDTGNRERASLLEPLVESVIDVLEGEGEESKDPDDSETLMEDVSPANPPRIRDRVFTVDVPLTLRQGNTGLVLLESFETTFTTSLIARPSSAPGVHMVGATRNTSDGIIPASRLRVIKDGRAFTGSMIPMVEEQIDFQIPLGIQDGIVITRRLVSREEVRTGLLNGGKLTTLTYRITVRNLNDAACQISLEDRIPVSGTEDIEVALKSATPQPVVSPNFDGTLQWSLKVPPGGPGSIPVAIDWEVTIAHSADLETSDFIE